jgi:cell division septum initiation protein DivIVA
MCVKKADQIDQKRIMCAKEANHACKESRKKEDHVCDESGSKEDHVCEESK